jgi:hypothetical protein
MPIASSGLLLIAAVVGVGVLRTLVPLWGIRFAFARNEKRDPVRLSQPGGILTEATDPTIIRAL